ncbi:hypothetical protein BABINDRAFT_124463 [Babjeviella inositovora NRRL Y-12698]|uniref:Uncharacterized protein n=1 Tax=Babjeviella inositovora NRRL Y-12698 TaxID=984486 RepID=A0A1E3QS14_9ASCO|nr:uncharacterized protein BABINDRAFT_124463 [Babjeviella inositovora NRRL Y-12698]ODQ80506.1 hypothetical protein BABINDRAFT_124463 [Babjeviella inositovora NRRL Y-12698]
MSYAIPMYREIESSDWSSLVRYHVNSIRETLSTQCSQSSSDDWVFGIKEYFTYKYLAPQVSKQITYANKEAKFDEDDASTRLAFALVSSWKGITKVEILDIIGTIEIVTASENGGSSGVDELLTDCEKMYKVRYWLSELRALRVYTRMLEGKEVFGLDVTNNLENCVLRNEGPIIWLAICQLEKLVELQLSSEKLKEDEHFKVETIRQFC